MIILVAISGILFFLNLSLGVYGLLSNPRSRTHIVFFQLSFVMAIIYILNIICQTLEHEKQVKLFIAWSTAFTLFIPYFSVIIGLQLSQKENFKQFYYILFIIPILFSEIRIIQLWRCFEVDFYKNSWRLTDVICCELPTYYFITIVIYTIVYITTIFRWHRKTNIQKEKLQALNMIWLFSFMVLIILVYNILFRQILKVVNYEINGIPTLFCSIWTIGIYRCIIKYRFLSITPGLVGNEIFSSINEAVIILNPDFSLNNINTKTREILNISEINANTLKLENIIVEYKFFINELHNIKKGLIKNFSCRINFRYRNEKSTLMDAQCNMVRDKYNDIIGYLIIANEVKEIKLLQALYDITQRESEVIQLAINGNTNKEIANELRITERTVKTYLTRIFNKIGVDNKLQLIMILKDYNLLPEKHSDKTLFLK